MENIIDKVCASIEAFRLEEPNPEFFWNHSYVSLAHPEGIHRWWERSSSSQGYLPIYRSSRLFDAKSSSICHQVFYNKYLLRRDPRDLHFALRALFKNVKLRPIGDKALVGPYASMSKLYLERFNHSRRDEDFQKTAFYGAKAVKLFSPDVGNGAYQLYRRALALMKAYESDGRKIATQRNHTAGRDNCSILPCTRLDWAWLHECICQYAVDLDREELWITSWHRSRIILG